MRVENWGLVPYQEALQKQLESVEAVSAAALEPNSNPALYEKLIVCTHPPVVTLGRGTKPNDVISWAGETVEISRGGRATYHGPSQIVVYPILNLNLSRATMPARDLHAYLRTLETAVIATLKDFGIESGTHEQLAKVKPIEAQADASFTGVWVKHLVQVKKIASIGIGVKKWISYHGLALNVSHDESAHKGIQPCGFQPDVMTSIEEVLGQKISQSIVTESLISHLKKYFYKV